MSGLRSDWHRAAACAGGAAPPAPCRECPVRAECIEEGLAQPVLVDGWGGFSAAELRAYMHARPVRLSTALTPRTPGPLQGSHRTMGHMNDDIEGAA